jgi:hypoxanthine phosphoribosyltransferase
VGIYLGIGGFLTGLVGAVLTVYYARKSERLNKLRKRLEWPDLQAAANDLGGRIKKDLAPVAIVTPGLTGATFANLLVAEFPNQPPVFVGTRTWKEDSYSSIPTENSFVIETKKWFVTIPTAATNYKDGKILIVDDFVMSGDFLDALRTRLVSEGIAAENIKSASIAATKIAIKNHKGPDYYWWLADDDDFFFPWGKAK